MFSESRKIIFVSRRASCFASEHPCPRPEPSGIVAVFLSPKTQPQTFRTSRTPAVGVCGEVKNAQADLNLGVVWPFLHLCL